MRISYWSSDVCSSYLVAPVVVSRIKVMARLDIAERRVPQDGRIGLTLAGKAVDVRVSTLPSRAGERVVMRILDKDAAGIDFDVLGLSGEADRILREALSEPNGITLLNRPTRSGKTPPHSPPPTHHT